MKKQALCIVQRCKMLPKRVPGRINAYSLLREGVTRLTVVRKLERSFEESVANT